MTKLFTPFQIKNLNLRNRIAVAPMCQYSAIDGVPDNWHHVHYAGLARGGAGLVIVEATAISSEGRITEGCLGIWNEKQTKEHAKIAKAIKEAGAVAGIQIGHAGRKASAEVPWKGGASIPKNDSRGWEIISPSAIPFGDNLTQVPKEMTIEDIEKVKNNFVSAAKHALEAGYQWLELHYAHGYLMQSFLSIHANKRNDQYGGDAKRRARFPIEIFQAVRKVWPKNLPLDIRLGVIEYDGRDEETINEAIDLIKILRDEGLDFVNVSMGFSTPDAKIPWKPALLTQIAKKVRDEAKIPVATAWGIGEPQIANKAIEDEEIDLAMVGHSHLINPHWPFYAAQELKIENPSQLLPKPYAHWLERYKSRS